MFQTPLVVAATLPLAQRNTPGIAAQSTRTSVEA